MNNNYKKLLAKAEIDLKTIENLIQHEDSPPESICFHAQQAAEKYLKAYLQYLEIKYNPSHDLDYLIKLISKKNSDFKKYFSIAEELTPYAVVVRYEEGEDAYTQKEAGDAYKNALKIKEHVMKEIIK